jgi:hypothetical protein
VIDFGIAKAIEGDLTDKNDLHAVPPIHRYARLHEPRAGGNERVGSGGRGRISAEEFSRDDQRIVAAAGDQVVI